MPRWTETHAEQVKIAGFPEFLEAHVTKPITVTLVNGQTFSGRFYSSTGGNNAGEGGWAYYAGITLETASGAFDIDYLDIEFAQIHEGG